MTHSIRTIPTPTRTPHKKVTPEAIQFSGSKHKGNRAQAWCALSTSPEDANEQMKRGGINWFARKRILAAYGLLCDMPDMTDPAFFLFTSEPLYDSIPPLPSKFEGYSNDEFMKAMQQSHEKIVDLYKDTKIKI